jgi:FkbM family methyltransferase
MIKRINLLLYDLLRRLPALPIGAVKKFSNTLPPIKMLAEHLPNALKSQVYDLVISPNEISFAHGTGVLLSRLLEKTDNILVARSSTYYGGSQNVKAKQAFVLPKGIVDRQDVFAEVVQWLRGYKIRSILCAPFFQTDVLIAIAAQSVTGAPMGLWVMDDNCLLNNGISRELMAEAIERASALFAISPELKQAYQTEFRKPFTILPPLVPETLIRKKPSSTPAGSDLLMIGNIWSPSILDLFSKTVRTAGIKIDWHSSNPDLWSHMISVETLEKRGVRVMQSGDPKELIELVVNARAIIIPSDPGTLAEGHEAALGKMSIPTRMPFILATAGTPMIVVGRKGTASANFVNRFNVGRAVDYDAKAIKNAIEELAKPEEQLAIRQRSAKLASSFSFDGVYKFVTDSIADGGRWPNETFESLFPHSGSYSIYQDKPAPKQFAKDFGDVVQFCDRLSAAGFTPDFVMDVGASTGIWSLAVHKVFDKARYILCDPMFSRYGKMWNPSHFELVEAAISDKIGKAVFSVSSDLYGSSLISVADIVEVTDKVEVNILTVDSIVKSKKIRGRGLLKVDVQYAEHLVIDGAQKTLAEHVDVVVLELTLGRADPKAKTLLEVSNQMDSLGFRIYDKMGHWRIPKSGEMEQMDLVFVRKEASFSNQRA